jgi:dehydrogenase/reductase SDR family member 12
MLGVSQWYFEGGRKYGKAGFVEASARFDSKDCKDMTGKIVAVTGANSGIGYATANRLAHMNASVHLVCRNRERCEDAKNSIIRATGNSKVFSHVCDVGVMASVRSFGSTFVNEVPQLDVLVNNAGGMPATRTLTEEGNEIIMATMVGGTLLLTDMLLPALCKSTDPRVINVSSGGAYSVRAHTTDLNCEAVAKYDGTFFYALAKRNQIVLTEMWDRLLREKGVPVAMYSMHPGWASTEGLKTAMADFHESNKDTLRSAEEGADTIVYLASSESDKVKYADGGGGGKFWFDREVVRTSMPWAGTESTEREKRELWDNSVAYVGGIKFCVKEN